MHTWSAILTVAAATTGLLNTAQGFIIDTDSCKGNDFTFVHDLVTQAFIMAESAVQAVNAQPPSAGTNDLYDRLLNAEPAVGQSLIKDTFEASGSGLFFKGILGFKEEKLGRPQDAKLGPNDVIIYCNQDRFKRRLKDPLHLYDPVIQEAVSKTGTDCAAAFAYTYRAKHKPNFIQMCPWFLEYAKEKQWRTGESIKNVRAKLAVKGADQWITNRKYTPVDLLSLWDKVMLHEMAHTRAGGLKDDVGGTKGYGWKNCVKMARDRPGDAANNADTYALFGSGSLLAKDGITVNEDGTLSNQGNGPQGGPGGQAGGRHRRGLPWSG